MTREDEKLVKALRNSYGYSEQRDKEAATAIERLSAKNAKLREAQRWIPVSERLPEYSMPYLTIDHGMCETLNYDANTNKWMDYEGYSANVTHWQALPKPPQEGGKK